MFFLFFTFLLYLVLVNPSLLPGWFPRETVFAFFFLPVLPWVPAFVRSLRGGFGLAVGWLLVGWLGVCVGGQEGGWGRGWVFGSMGGWLAKWVGGSVGRWVVGWVVGWVLMFVLLIGVFEDVFLSGGGDVFRVFPSFSSSFFLVRDHVFFFFG